MLKSFYFEVVEYDFYTLFAQLGATGTAKNNEPETSLEKVLKDHIAAKTDRKKVD